MNFHCEQVLKNIRALRWISERLIKTKCFFNKSDSKNSISSKSMKG